jgi:hypothetical protein
LHLIIKEPSQNPSIPSRIASACTQEGREDEEDKVSKESDDLGDGEVDEQDDEQQRRDTQSAGEQSVIGAKGEGKISS